MQLRFLKTFIAVADTLNFTCAAARLRLPLSFLRPERALPSRNAAIMVLICGETHRQFYGLR